MGKGISLITGGSSGLGLELAKKHYENGDSVCILGRSQKRLDSAIEKIIEGGGGGEVIAMSCNVSIESEVEEVFSQCASRGYRVKNVYNVAGIGAVCAPEDIDQGLINDLLEANFIGLIIVSTQAIRAMKKTGGNIINVMSTVSKRANPNEALYCGVKWGARGYTESIQAALKGSNTNVFAVYPGGMNTSFWHQEHVVTPDLSNFMQASEVAGVIYGSVNTGSTLKVSEIMIVRK